MAEPSDFDTLVGWLSDREGKSVCIEVGTDDPDPPEPHEHVDSYALLMHAVIGSIEPAHDVDHDRLAVMIQLPELKSSRIYLEPDRVSKVERWGDSFKVWFHDAFYVAFSG